VSQCVCVGEAELVQLARAQLAQLQRVGVHRGAEAGLVQLAVDEGVRGVVGGVIVSSFSCDLIGLFSCG
jgi:hypothetical protein